MDYSDSSTDNDDDQNQAMSSRSSVTKDCPGIGNRACGDQNSCSDEFTRVVHGHVQDITCGGQLTTMNKNVYGIGASLALKMGYQPGKGLGKNLKGIPAPIEIKQRKGRTGIGSDRPQRVKTDIRSMESLSIHRSTSNSSKKLNWRKSTKRDTEKETVIQYVSGDEVLDQRHKSMYLQRRCPDPFTTTTKVIDMTGPETKILTGYGAIFGQKLTANAYSEIENPSYEDSDFGASELIHNINLLIDNCDADIVKNSRKSKWAVQRETIIKKELERLLKKIQQGTGQIQSTRALINLIKTLVPGIDHDEVIQIFAKIQKEHPEEWRMFELHNLVGSTAIPILLARLSTWNLLENSTEPLQLFTDWKILLTRNEKTFYTIVWEAWMPSIRLCLENWDIRDANPVIQLLQNWKPVLPNGIFSHILDQIILPKISEEIDTWKPILDGGAWFLPWFPIYGTKLEELYPLIRQKLGQALTHWQPYDGDTNTCAKKMLISWCTSRVFSKMSMATLLSRHIIPKLQLILEEFSQENLDTVPQHFELERWNLVIEWCELIPCRMLIADILSTTFFPKWLQVLVVRMSQTPLGPNLEDIQNWYTQWKTLFPDVLVQEPLVQENLRKALEMIAIHLQGTRIDFGDIINRPSPATEVQQSALADSYIPDVFRDLVQMKCEKLGLLFMPMMPSRYQDGKQVYHCGKAAIFITENVIFTLRDGTWLPISLRELI